MTEDYSIKMVDGSRYGTKELKRDGSWLIVENESETFEQNPRTIRRCTLLNVNYIVSVSFESIGDYDDSKTIP